MAFFRKFSEREKAYIIQWQHDKSPGAIASELNQWPENKDDPRQTDSIRQFLYRRRRQVTPGQE